MEAADPRIGHLNRQQNTGGINVNVIYGPNNEEPKPKAESLSPPPYAPQNQFIPQPQMNQVPFQQPQFQQPQFQQPQFQQPQYIAAQQPVVFNGNLGSASAVTTCTNCGLRVPTNVTYKSGAFAWLMCFVFILFCGFFGCCLIPFFMDAFKDAHHCCPQCRANLHVYKRL